MPIPPDIYERDMVISPDMGDGDFVRVLTDVGGGVLASRRLRFPDFLPGIISDMGAKMEWVSTSSYRVTPGRAHVNNGSNSVVLEWASNITRSSLSLTASTLYYVYLYSNSGTAAVEESTTVPVWNDTLNMWVKTGNTSRRCIGYITIDGSSGIRKFLNTVMGRVSEFIITDGSSASDKRVVTSGTQSASWASFSMAPFVPAHATYAYINGKIASGTAVDDAILGLSPIDLGSAIGGTAPYTVRARNDLSGGSVFFGTAWLAINTALTYYYRIQHVAGTTSVANIEMNGARIYR